MYNVEPEAEIMAAGPRRLSRQFSTVGVDIPAGRLRTIASEGPATEDEWVDVSFALMATTLLAEERRSRRARAQRRVAHWAVVATATVLALNALLCLGVLFLTLAQRR